MFSAEFDRDPGQLVPKALRMLPTDGLDLHPVWLALAHRRISPGLSTETHGICKAPHKLATQSTSGK